MAPRRTSLVLLLVLSAGCGTRVSRSGNLGAASARADLPRSTVDASGAPELPLGAVAVPGDTLAGAPEVSAAGVGGPIANATRSGAGQSRAPSAAGATNRAGEPAAGRSAAATTSEAAGTTRSGASPAPPPAGGATPAPPAAPPQQTGLSPLLLGSVGTLSGPIGATLLPTLQGAQVWVKFANARGGLGGHPIKMAVFDDGADPARHRSQVQEAIERNHVVAFLSNVEGQTGESSQSYIESKRIPVIGSETGGDFFYNSPMYFPQAPHGTANFAAGLLGAAGQLVPKGKTRLATVTCVEATPCAVTDDVWQKESPAAGFQHVYRGRASLTQPDFTAECLSARNAGAEVFLAGLDPASIQRLAQSCARQGYRPTFGTFASLITDRMKDDPNLDGMVSASNVFPYFQTGTPAPDEFREAMRVFGGGLPLGVGVALGWVSGKLLETAAAHLSEPPTSANILQGLWSLRADTLGGLTQPLTFVEDEPAKKVSCWFDVTIRNAAWVSPDGFRQRCRQA